MELSTAAAQRQTVAMRRAAQRSLRSLRARPPERGAIRAPLWTLGSAGAAPVLLIGGWTLAARRQRPGYDSCRDTISSLAARGAEDRWLMTTALAGLGLCHIFTALGLTPARRSGRGMLATGGAATLMVAAFPQSREGKSVPHATAAAAAFVALGVWPAFAASGRSRVFLLELPVSTLAVSGLMGLLAWFATELNGDSTGLAERALAGAESFWPLAVAISACRGMGTAGRAESVRTGPPSHR